RIRVDLRNPQGATFQVIARELKRMDSRRVNEIFRRHLADAARPYPARVRASVMAIPTTGEKHTGLRARIAQCVEVSSGADTKSAWVSVWINPFRMRPDYTSLPLRMEGASARTGGRRDSRWRHPVFGTAEQAAGVRGHGRGWVWVTQPSHPYFYQATRPLGRAAGEALKAGLEDIT